MLSFLLSLAGARLPTEVFEDDGQVLAWIEQNDRLHRAVLPVIGPASMARLESELSGAVRFVHVPPTEDAEAVAQVARLDYGSSCALVLAPLSEGGWAGWTSGACGMLNVAGWRYEFGRLHDGTGRTLTLPAFAGTLHDTATSRAFQRIERRKSATIVGMMLGGGLFFAASSVPSEERRSALVPALQIGSAGVGLGSLAAFLRIQTDPRSRPRRLDAWYPEAFIRDRVRRHNLAAGLAEGPDLPPFR